MSETIIVAVISLMGTLAGSYWDKQKKHRPHCISLGAA